MERYYLNTDWLAFTFHGLGLLSPDSNLLEQFKVAFPELKEELDNSLSMRIRSHYSHVYGTPSDFVIAVNLINEDTDFSRIDHLLIMGVNVQIPSHSLATFFELMGVDRNDVYALPKMLSILKERNCELSRLDLCFDDYSKRFTGADYLKWWANGQIQTPYVVDIVGKATTGFTCYFGSLKKRDKLLRIYDKFLESDGVIDAVRYEFELHADKARSVCEMILTSFSEGIDFPNLLFQWVKIKVPSSNTSNLSMVSFLPEWLEWLDSFNPLKREESQESSVNSQFNAEVRSYILPIKIPPYDKHRYETDLNHYVLDQAMPSCAGFVQCFGMHAFTRELNKCIKQDRINPKYKRYMQKLISSDEYFVDVKYKDKNPFYLK